MRVFLVRNVAPEKFGGGETYQIMLANALKNSGFESYILTASRKLLAEAGARGIKTIKTPYLKKQNWSGLSNFMLFRFWFWQRRLRRFYKKIFKEYRPNVINVQSRDDWLAATSVAHKDGKIKILWTDHMDFRSWVLTNVNIRYKNFIGKWILKSATKVDQIIFISNFEREWFERQVAPRRFSNLVTIKNGVEDKITSYSDAKAMDQSFSFVGRIVDYKGIFDLISAFLEIVPDFPEATLNIYGEGEALEECKKKARGIQQIRFYGYTKDPLKAIAKNEVFVLPSYREGLSLSLLDAAMLGKKIIATDIDGNPEVVEDKKTGLLVPAKDVDELTEVMRYMLENSKEANNFAKNVRIKYEQEFNFKKIFDEKMLPLYNSEKE